MKGVDLVAGQRAVVIGVGLVEHLFEGRHPTHRRRHDIRILPVCSIRGRLLCLNVRPIHAPARPHTPAGSGTIRKRLPGGTPSSGAHLASPAAALPKTRTGRPARRVLVRGPSPSRTDRSDIPADLVELLDLLFRQDLFDRIDRPRPGFRDDVLDLLDLVVG